MSESSRNTSAGTPSFNDKMSGAPMSRLVTGAGIGIVSLISSVLLWNVGLEIPGEAALFVGCLSLGASASNAFAAAFSYQDHTDPPEWQQGKVAMQCFAAAFLPLSALGWCIDYPILLLVALIAIPAIWIPLNRRYRNPTPQFWGTAYTFGFRVFGIGAGLLYWGFRGVQYIMITETGGLGLAGAIFVAFVAMVVSAVWAYMNYDSIYHQGEAGKNGRYALTVAGDFTGFDQRNAFQAAVANTSNVEAPEATPDQLAELKRLQYLQDWAGIDAYVVEHKLKMNSRYKLAPWYQDAPTIYREPVRGEIRQEFGRPFTKENAIDTGETPIPHKRWWVLGSLVPITNIDVSERDVGTGVMGETITILTSVRTMGCYDVRGLLQNGVNWHSSIRADRQDVCNKIGSEGGSDVAGFTGEASELTESVTIQRGTAMRRETFEFPGAPALAEPLRRFQNNPRAFGVEVAPLMIQGIKGSASSERAREQVVAAEIEARATELNVDALLGRIGEHLDKMRIPESDRAQLLQGMLPWMSGQRQDMEGLKGAMMAVPLLQGLLGPKS